MTATLCLEATAVYLTPSGRCCRWSPAPEHNRELGLATFVYIRDGKRPDGGVFEDTFTLARENWGLLRRLN